MITELRPIPPSIELKAPQTAPLLAVERLKAYYRTQLFGVDREVRAVDDVSFKINRNEIYGLAGESSSGLSKAPCGSISRMESGISTSFRRRSCWRSAGAICLTSCKAP
jgi:ABC-type glutathione transport system ATPase component